MFVLLIQFRLSCHAWPISSSRTAAFLCPTHYSAESVSEVLRVREDHSNASQVCLLQTAHFGANAGVLLVVHMYALCGRFCNW